MSFFEETNITDKDGNLINPSTEESSSTTRYLISKLFQILKPLSVIAGNGNSHLSVDIGKIGGANPNQGTIGSISTVTTVNNQNFTGGVANFLNEKNMSHIAFQNSIRNHINF